MATRRLLSVAEALRPASSAGAAPVTVAGWVQTVRRQKRVSFVQVSDGSSARPLQVVADASLPKEVAVGASIRATGTMESSLGEGQQREMRAHSVTVVGECGSDYPLQKKEHSEEFLRDHAHLRARTSAFAATMRLRNAASRGLHDYLQQGGFVEINAPIIVSSDCEGAGEMFKVTADPADAGPFFGTDAYLTVSAQLHGEAFCCALSKVYVFGPTFRAERNSRTAQHLAEFWMLEPEVAHHDLSQLMDLIEGTVRAGAAAVADRVPDDVALLRATHGAPVLEAPRSFARMTYSEAVAALLAGAGTFAVPVEWGMDLQREHERWLCEQHTGGVPLFVTDYPAAIKPFYAKRSAQRDDCVQAVDLLVPQIGELVGGSVREDALDALVQRMEAKRMDAAAYAWYTDLRRYGTVPHAGFGMGFERFLMYVSGIRNIRDTIPVPRWTGNIKM